MADQKPTGTDKTPSGVEFPTEDLPGTAHPNPPQTDQQGVKGMDPGAGSQKESKAPAGTPGVEPLEKR